MIFRNLCALILGGCLLLASISYAAEPAIPLRMNQIQVLGTHNSYHLKKSERPAHADWDYEHPPIDAQLARGIRSFELDLHLKEGGWEVFHIPLLDNHSSCPKLADCLQTVVRWSRENPNHVPISFLCEIKEEGRPLDKSILDFDSSAADRLDAEIRSVFDDAHLITPDQVRGSATTLNEAVKTKGWPLLDDSRGKVFFILHEDGPYRDVYVKDRPSLEGRAMFVRSSEGRPDCATLVEDTPNVERVQRLVREGYWIRTRADGGLRPGLAPEGMTRADAALASGAHIISTDHPAGQPHPKTGATIGLPGGVSAVCNSVIARDCGFASLE